MGLLEDLREPSRVYTLRMDEILAELSPEDREAVEAALRDVRVTAGRISTALSKNGHSVSVSSVRAWRQRHESR